MEESLIARVRDTFALPETDIKTYSPLTLAYIGDGIYDLIIRTMLVEKGNSQVNKLHQKASSLVKATAQKEILHAIQDILTEEELGVFKRGRNAKSVTTAKNASVTDYRIATGFEAMIGYLYMTEQMERILYLVKEGLTKTDLLV
ncbi:Mini-ribonuclease 3 [Lachnoclostridium phytofermentans]|uniref:Mini-ribonuclease 3 n=1 Tax=Lachnoclostridium phytofermentans (strain ATCC 700394 / DSM 18823 / ISDg) TaxID=357809 RepID=A9KSM4_LACP7|nr:ribonuclease III domain-containing protein [Lachnoclostridium phytofermentans]ABX43676.1 ribonuclease III [Lachnoclostridium phytofermentans ISDg]